MLLLLLDGVCQIIYSDSRAGPELTLVTKHEHLRKFSIGGMRFDRTVPSFHCMQVRCILRTNILSKIPL